MTPDETERAADLAALEAQACCACCARTFRAGCGAADGDTCGPCRVHCDGGPCREDSHDVTHLATPQCACTCGCREPATGKDEGSWVCDECADYYVTPSGEVVCHREQDDETCRHCTTAIEWGQIQAPAGPSPHPNATYGSCACPGREWVQHQRGGRWELSEVDVRAREEQDEQDAQEDAEAQAAGDRDLAGIIEQAIADAATKKAQL